MKHLEFLRSKLICRLQHCQPPTLKREPKLLLHVARLRRSHHQAQMWLFGCVPRWFLVLVVNVRELVTLSGPSRFFLPTLQCKADCGPACFSTTVTHVTTPARDGKGVLKVMPLAPRHDSNRWNAPCLNAGRRAPENSGQRPSGDLKSE